MMAARRFPAFSGFRIVGNAGSVRMVLAAGLLLSTTPWAAPGCKGEPPEASAHSTGRVGAQSGKHGRAWGTMEQVAEGVGEPVRASKVQGEPWVAVFHETHVSRVGQVEMALMLYRLYRDHGMRHIALEGYVKDTAVDASWFHKLPGTTAERKHVATQLLQDGEISGAEYMALLFPDLSLHAIEEPAQYGVQLADGAGGAGLSYLLRIALKLLEDPATAAKHTARINELQSQDKQEECLEYILEIDPWVAEKARVFRQKGKPLQTEEWLDLFEEIEKRARDVGASPEPGERENMRNLKNFFATAQERSGSMVDATLSLARLSSGPPIAMIIGAAHTSGVCSKLDTNRAPYIVISPRSLASGDETGDIDIDAFVRKGRGLSVDGEGLGRLLDGRKKPPPVISQPWLEAKADLYFLTAKIASRVGGAGGAPPTKPPYGLSSEELDLPAARVDPASIKLIGEEVVFLAAIFPNDPKRMRSLWVRAKAVAEPVRAESDVDVELLLKTALEKLRSGKEGSARIRERADTREESETTTPVVHVSSDVIAKFSTTQAGINSRISI